MPLSSSVAHNHSLLLPLQGPFSLQDLAQGLSAGHVSRDLQLYHLAASTEVLYSLHQLLDHAEQQPERQGPGQQASLAAAPEEQMPQQVSPPQQPQLANGHVRNGLTAEGGQQAKGLPGKAVAANSLAQQGLHGPAQPADGHALVRPDDLEHLSSHLAQQQNGSAEPTEPCGTCAPVQVPLNGLRGAAEKQQASRPSGLGYPIVKPAPGPQQHQQPQGAEGVQTAASSASRPPGLGHVPAKPAPGSQQHQQPQGAEGGQPAASRGSRPPGLGRVPAKPAPESQQHQQPQGAQVGQTAASRGQQAAPGVMDVKAALASARWVQETHPSTQRLLFACYVCGSLSECKEGPQDILHGSEARRCRGHTILHHSLCARVCTKFCIALRPGAAKTHDLQRLSNVWSHCLLAQDDSNPTSQSLLC